MIGQKGGVGLGGLRRTPWASLATPIGAVVGLAVLLAVGGDAEHVPLIDDLVMVLLSAYATVCGVWAARSAQGRLRTAWATMSVALAAWTVADLIWLLSEYVFRVEPFPSPADFFYLVFSALAIPAMLRMAPAGTYSRRHADWRITLDAVTVALCTFLLAWILALGGVYEAYGQDRLGLALALFYPTADIAILAVAVAVWARVDSGQRTMVGLLVLGFAITTVTDSAFAYFIAEGTYATGNLLDVGWAVALVAICAAALVSRRMSPPRTAELSVPSATALWAPYVPLLLVGTIGPAMIMSGLPKVIVPLLNIAVCLRQGVAAFENRRWSQAAADQALKDPLTGLANRALFVDRLTHAITLRSRDERPVMVAALDLDDFTFVNDNLGHPVGDELLLQAGRRITECLRPGDTVGRVGADDFVLLLEGDLDDSREVLRRVVETFDEPFTVDGQLVSIRCRVGVAAAEAAGSDFTPETLMQGAALAVQAAKRPFSPRIRTFDADIANEPALSHGEDTARVLVAGAAKVRMLADLRHAVEHGEFGLVYQPKVDLRSGRVVGVEGLLRWLHPELGVLQPAEFMPLVRQHNLIRPVTDLVVEKALDDAARWADQGVPTPVALNMLAPSLRDTRLPTTLAAALERRALPARSLTVEITEDLVIKDLGLVTGVLRQLRERGMRVAIDDFGTGYSALSYLRDLWIDEIKLDRSFVAGVTRDVRAAAVVCAVIDLTHGLGMTVVAEGIEDVATADWLRGNGCDVGQGYHFGRPTEADDVPGLVVRVGEFAHQFREPSAIRPEDVVG
ncbi:putative bifunctional diguanylate cyclase/phosphodiesterase [Mycobacterium sp. SMC-4]|uniref:putative bifunctional diguanylate cyclase/phosphodiesterase n=1 Tax=Mycobacterium sp. SMC-4 TaxID=2857059 RepID=UPI003D01026A